MTIRHIHRHKRFKRHVSVSARNQEKAYNNQPARVDARNFYKSPEWLQIKADMFNRFGRDCWKCDSEEVGWRRYIDHIIPRHADPERELDPSNLQILCGLCHNRKSKADALRYGTATNPKVSPNEVNLRIL